MRRLARHLFTLCAAASLLLCVAVCVLWARSRRYHDSLYWNDTRRDDAGAIVRVAQYTVKVYGGKLVLCREVHNTAPFLGGNPFITEWPYQDEPALGGRSYRLTYRPSWRPAGFYFRDFGDDEHKYRYVGTPIWAGVLALAATPATWLWRGYRRGRRSRRGLCAHCGYDLRASPGRCPECGAAAAASGDSAG